MRTHSLRSLRLVPALAFALLLAASGCDQADETALAGPTSPDAQLAALPTSFTLQDLPSSLALSPEQSSSLQSAVDRLNAARQERWAEHRAKEKARGGSEMTPTEPPLFTFLEDASSTLSTEQFVILTNFLSERQSARRADGGRGEFGARMRHGMRQHLDRFSERHGLSKEQGSALRSELRAKGDELDALAREVEAGTITPEEARDRAKAIREEMRASAEKVLSPEQISRFEERRSVRRGEVAERRLAELPVRMERRAQFLTRVLSLDATQAAAVRSVLDQSVEARRANLERMKSGSLAPEEAMYDTWTLERATAEKVRAILSSEQATRFDAVTKLVPASFRMGGVGRFGR